MTTRATPSGPGGPVIGLEVRSSSNENVGKIDTVLVSPDGKVQKLVVAVGGVLGVGARDVVDWSDLRINQAQHAAVTSMSNDELKNAPEYRAHRTAETGGGPNSAPPRPAPSSSGPSPTGRTQ